MVFGIEMTEVRGVELSWKRDQAPPPSQTVFQQQVFFPGEVRTHLLYGR